MSSPQSTTPWSPAFAAARLFLDRKNRVVHPTGTFDRQRRWYPAATEERPCCAGIRRPSGAWPMSLMLHCRTLEHVCSLVGADAAAARWWIAEEKDPGCHERADVARREKARASRAQRAAIQREITPAPVVPRLDLARCPHCAMRVAGESPSGLRPIQAHQCSACGAWAHQDCAAELGHMCGRYGCRGDLIPAVWIPTAAEPIEVARAEIARAGK